MAAPEKVYFTPTENGTYYYTEGIPFERESIEYIRKDAFIDKMAIWFNNNFIVHDEYGVISDSFDTKEEMFENFKRYIEEQK